MGKTLLLFGLLTVILITGCSKENIVEPVSTQDGDGKMLLKIDKTNTPKNVATVTAYLTRTNYDTLKGFLNLKSDTSADMTFQNIPVGTWHLKIDAKDQSGSVTYTGETDVTIVESMTIQVSLTLQPVSGSVGGIYILVNWGSATSYKWTDYSGNPILSRTDSTFDAFGVRYPMVLIEDNIFKMWYQNSDQWGVSTVGYAVSGDGINWTRNSQLVLQPSTFGNWDSYSVGHGSVIKINDVYMMYYTGSDCNYTKIGLATSTDGINWTKYSGNPILTADKSWEGGGIYSPSVIYDNNQYIMVFQNKPYNNSAFGMATSTDGINWTKDSLNPFVTYNDTYNHWAVEIQSPCIRKYNNEWRIYYTGYRNASELSIGLLRRVSK